MTPHSDRVSGIENAADITISHNAKKDDDKEKIVLKISDELLYSSQSLED